MKREEYMVRAEFFTEAVKGFVVNDDNAKFGPCRDRKTAEAIVLALAGRTDCFRARIELAEDEERP